jgi:hypothetical protein
MAPICDTKHQNSNASASPSGQADLVSNRNNQMREEFTNFNAAISRRDPQRDVPLGTTLA